MRDHFDQIFVLNMARAIKRRAVVLVQASKLGLCNVKIIRAVDGNTLNLEEMLSQGMLQRGHTQTARVEPQEKSAAT